MRNGPYLPSQANTVENRLYLPSLPISWRDLMTPRAVPYPAVARLPVLQCVSTLIGLPSGKLCRMSRAPKCPIALLSATSSFSISSIWSMNLRHKFKNGVNHAAGVRLQEHRATRMYLSFIWDRVHVSFLLRSFAKLVSSLAAVLMLTAVGRAVNR